MGWIVRAVGAGALVSAVCVVPATVAAMAGAAGPAEASVAETDGAAARVSLARHLGVVDTLLARELPRSYAGSWVDEPAGGVAVVAATSAVPPRLRTAVRALLPVDAQIEYRLVATR
jgi:hypothetical protein